MKRVVRRQTYQPGLPPGTIVDRTDAPLPLSITIIDYDRGALRVRKEASIDEVVPTAEGARRWIRVRGTPSRELLGKLGESFNAHRLILEDIASAGQRIKVEDYDTLMFTVLRGLAEPASGTNGSTREERTAITPRPEIDLSLLMTDTTLVTILEHDDDRFFAPITARLENPDSLLRANEVDFLYHAVVDLVVDRFFPVVEELEGRASDLEAAILEDASERHLRSIHALRRATQQLRSIVWSFRDVTSRVERSTHRFVRQETLFYFRDIHDHIVHLLDAVSTLRDTANGLMELYMTGVSNRMNEVMKVLTIISTIFIPGTFIAGVYGMNFEHMPELGVRWAYPAVMGAIGIIALAMLMFFKRRRWF